MGHVDERIQREILRRLRKYKRPPTIKALRRRLGRLCGGDWGVECTMTALVREGAVRVACGVFCPRPQ